MTTLKTLAFGLALLVTAGPAFASSEAPVSGQARAIEAPAYVANGDAAPSFQPHGKPVTSGTSNLALAAEATIGLRG